MVHLESIEVKGLSDVGPFRGTLPLSPGLQVVSAHNSHGKSLAATTIVWCLGAEPMLGQDNNPTCFPLAAREEIEIEGHKVKVISSECSIQLALMRQKLSRSRGRWQCG